jgi:hypothetical protein
MYIEKNNLYSLDEFRPLWRCALGEGIVPIWARTAEVLCDVALDTRLVASHHTAVCWW